MDPIAPKHRRTLIFNRRELRRHILHCAEQRAHKFTRVSEEAMLDFDTRFREYVRECILRLPSVGKTVYPPIRARSLADGS